MKKLDAQMRRFCRQFLTDLDTPKALMVKILMDHNEWDQLVVMTLDPMHYLDSPFGAARFTRDYQAVEFLRKCPDLPTSFQRRKEALKSFWNAEFQCFKTNQRLAPFLDHPCGDDQFWRVQDFLERVKKRVGDVLGPIPHTLEGRCGPGSVFESSDLPTLCPVRGQRRRKKITVGDKFSSAPTSTPAARLYVDNLLPATAWWRAVVSEFPYQSSSRTVPGNRFTTVPKSAKTDRGICIEPGANVFLQLGVGAHIRSRLKRVANIDLEHGQRLHGSLAVLASLTGEFATIDLSSASDTVCRVLVQLLVPDQWFQLLNDLRSHKTLVEVGGGRTKWVYLEKFSSMGNGFTFELETLIFWAIVQELSDHPVHVYGDDIIVHRSAFDDAIAALKFCGFTPNERKTYNHSAFRESCGTDVFSGFVIPSYRLVNLPDDPSGFIGLANGVRRALGRETKAWRIAIGEIPRNIRLLCRGPRELGDLVIYDPLAGGRVHWSRRYFRVWSPIHKRRRLSEFKPEVQLALALYGAPSNGLIPRDAVSGYKMGYAVFS